MTKEERRLYLEYCREIDEHNIAAVHDHDERWKRARRPYMERVEKFQKAPWWKKPFVDPGAPIYPFVLDPFTKEPSLEGFYRWLAEKEENGRQ